MQVILFLLACKDGFIFISRTVHDSVKFTLQAEKFGMSIVLQKGQSSKQLLVKPESFPMKRLREIARNLPGKMSEPHGVPLLLY